MNIPPIALALIIVTSVGILVLPRRWAPIALLVGCCYMRSDLSVFIGSLRFPIVRLLVCVGFLRCLMRGERIEKPYNTMDKLVFALCCWIPIAGLFHNQETGAGFEYAVGLAMNLGGVYFLTRVFCRDLDDIYLNIRILAYLLIPISAGMIMEKVTHDNVFFAFAANEKTSIFREGSLRAQGPFRHPILAGTVGAVCLPLFLGLRARMPILSWVAMAACVVMVIASASSGPIMTLAAVIGAILLWRYRDRGPALVKLAVAGALLASLMMGQPPYFILSRIDLAGGSTGWHRAQLIDQSLRHLNEWWMYGTDYTRHWMPTGVTFSKEHTDITNYYLAFGVSSGLLAVILVILLFITAIKWAGKCSLLEGDAIDEHRYFLWMIAAAMLGHAATSVSVSYYDQSFLFFWFTLALASTCYSTLVINARPPDEPQPD